MAAKLWNNLLDYFRASWQEIKRVNWPTKAQSIRYTIIVIILTAVVMVFLGIVDALFSWLYFQASNYFQVL